MRVEVKCRHCGKPRYSHKAKTFHCPVGRKTRIGYLDYSETNTYQPKETP